MAYYIVQGSRIVERVDSPAWFVVGPDGLSRFPAFNTPEEAAAAAAHGLPAAA